MSASLLEKLLSGREYSPLIVLQDTLEQSSFILLQEFVVKAVSSNRRIIWLTTETSVTSLERYLPKEIRVVYIDAYSNVFASESDHPKHSPSLYVLKDASDLNEAETLIKRLTQSTNVPYTLVLDSLSSFIRDSTTKTFRFVKNLVADVKEPSNILATYHGDIPDTSSASGYPTLPHISSAFSQLASTKIIVKNILERDPLDYEEEEPREYITEHSNSLTVGKCELEHKRKSGKVVREVMVHEEY
ncbi:hypothetical protein K7432_001120 [Basidiobolus ranarum]|uniref:Elongator complex protein 5 n=1 Tax=Basidiobolus ranarum TaxID=34480 RepID=A0ABR2X3G6_9FUNG